MLKMECLGKMVTKKVILLFVGVVLSGAAFGGFLKLPDTTEVPKLERKSLLKDLDIPPVRDRDPDPQGGPRLNVTEFRIQGLVEYPKLGISREAIIKQVEDIRFDLMQEGELTDSGFTLDELGELSDLIGEIEEETEGRHVGPSEVQRIVFLVREQRRKRGITLGMIETVADTITRYYRERGFILAKAYIPQQKVRDGVVTLTLLLGELGDVEIQNNKRAHKGHIRSVLKGKINEPVTSKRIEEALYLINDIPGLSAQGYFQPGKQVGDTQLNVNVLQEEWYTANIRLDNHGSDETGVNRLYGDVFIHNPLGIGDELHLSILNSFNPSNTVFGSARYSTHLFTPRWRASIGSSRNDFISTVPIFDSENDEEDIIASLEGESVVSDISIKRIFRRSRVRNFSADLTFTSIESDLFLAPSDNSSNNDPDGDGSGGAIPLQNNSITNLRLGFNFDVLVEKSRKLHAGTISLTSTDSAPVIETLEVDGDGIGQQIESTESAIFLSWDYTNLSFFRIPTTNYETRVVLKSSGQIAGKALGNLNQLSLTGPTKLRAFDVNATQYDDGIYLGIDWILKFPDGPRMFGQRFGDIFQPFLFLDTGFGKLYGVDSDTPDIEANLSDIGVGLKFGLGNFSGSLTFANPITSEFGVEGLETSSNMYFDMQYRF